LLFLIIPVDIIHAGNPPDAGHSSFNLSFSGSNQVSADGITTVNITITLKDSSGNALSGDTVNLTANNDSTAVFNPTSTTLDGSGVATFTIKSNNAGTDNINVNDTTTNTTLTNFGTVVFTSPTPTPTTGPSPTPTPSNICADSAPGSAPKLNTAISNSPHQITITWTKASDPVTYYLLSFGLAPGKYEYGDPNIGGPTTTSYTINNLTTGKRYYFIVRGGNGCMPGAFSNELSAVAGGALPTHTPTPTSSTDSVNTDEDSVDSQISETPTETPTPEVTPTPKPTTNTSVSLTQKIVLGGTLLGIFILIGVFVWSYLDKRRHPVKMERLPKEKDKIESPKETGIQ
jgi:hypothetical protein